MMRRDGRLLFSASDLVNFMGCSHATFLDARNLREPAVFPPDDDAMVLLQEKGIEHERAYLERLRAEGRSIVEVTACHKLNERVELTRAAMRGGADVVYQGAFARDCWHGYSDFLLKVDLPSPSFGAWSYEVADTKLSRSAKPKHLLQMCVYADMLAHEQGVATERMHVLLGDGRVATFRTDSISHYFAVARDRFEAFTEALPSDSAGDPCNHCALCRWAPSCGEVWEAQDHLSIVAGMTRGQVESLRAVGVDALPALAGLHGDLRVPGIQQATLGRLRDQARLQAHQRATGKRVVELLPPEPGRGFGRLPRPDPGDMMFDMEGDPLFDGGLEYLFGVVAVDDGVERFHAFWAHDREAERRAFEATVDFMTARLAAHPAAHVYHYAAYEETAFKRLAMYHGSREAEVDQLLREGRLVDLYKVVREALRTSEPRYSIKNMERFYLEGGRTGEVKTAGDSIVIYERWRRLGDQRLLDDIAVYNEIDCVSTLRCRDWLLTLRPDTTPWPTPTASHDAEAERVDARSEAQGRQAALEHALLSGTGDEREWRQLVVDLLGFHRREAKPTWWAMFDRAQASVDQLLNDPECIAGISPAPGVPPRVEKRSSVHAFVFPPQDFKLKVGDRPLLPGTLAVAGEVVAIDEDARVVELKIGPGRNAPVSGTSLIPAGPLGDRALRDAVGRYAEVVARGGEDRYAAVTAILRRSPPRLRGRIPGQAIVAEADDLTGATITTLEALQDSHLLIQGPPGAGKTYTSSQAIVALLAAGARIGVASSSHKAINQLLGEVEALAAAQGLQCKGAKKSSREDQMLGLAGWIDDVLDAGSITAAHRLVAGTAWLFARPEFDQAFDYLFVDEAGQVGLANIVAMGVAARNIVLVGDQMQLAQPIKGTHPRGSGSSALDHLLGAQATVPRDRGVFLSETRRMHPALARFVSDAVYEGRLRSAGGAERQRIDVDPALDPGAIAPAGLRFVPVDSVGCTQRSSDEAQRLARTYHALLGGRWTDRHGCSLRIGLGDILVVSPYNMQVDLLRRVLPAGARVGTVDRFQGQEAPVVLVSMATSSGEDLPRDIEFLYSRNRLNVAVSRARCLAVIYASPRLLEVPCSTIHQMELVDALCWAKSFADAQRGAAGGPAPL